ncbi:hypothetical protein [Nonomuraea sp. C10]|uniref:hypothetical protein n=1 Tax=Nonomuraea sp. C10 TaxID=2600577 RepID=UPI0016503EF2|nr:hypothetical protein [Nonomuraea sp. C10]
MTVPMAQMRTPVVSTRAIAGVAVALAEIIRKVHEGGPKLAVADRHAAVRRARDMGRL